MTAGNDKPSIEIHRFLEDIQKKYIVPQELEELLNLMLLHFYNGLGKIPKAQSDSHWEKIEELLSTFKRRAE